MTAPIAPLDSEGDVELFISSESLPVLSAATPEEAFAAFADCALSVGAAFDATAHKSVAVDRLHQIAEAAGLPASHGEDEIAAIMADAFSAALPASWSAAAADYRKEREQREQRPAPLHAVNGHGAPIDDGEQRPFPPVEGDGGGLIDHAKRFPLVSFDDIRMASGNLYLVKGFVPKRGLVVIWGPPKSGKSFFVFDLLMHVALGWTYRGMRVMRGVVVYIVLEGAEGFKRRIEAFRRQNSNSRGASFHVIEAPLDLIRDHPALIAAIRAQLGETIPAAICIDTLNRSLVGSESSDEDMANYVRAAGALDKAFECVVPIIHHCGHGGDRPRGHSSLLGALDVQIAIKRDDVKNIVATLEQSKDGPVGLEIVSRLVPVDVGLDDDGDPITSCVIEPVGEPSASSGDKKKLAPSAAAALKILHEALAECGVDPPNSDRIPSGVKAVTRDRWRDYCAKLGLSSSNEPRARNQAFNRAWDTLSQTGTIGIFGDHVWVARK